VACRPEPAISVAIDLARAVVSHARGDAPAGLELLRAAQQDLRRLHGPHALTVSLREWEARLLAANGRAEQAQALLQRSDRGPRSSVATLAAGAELQLAKGDPAGAIATLRPCLDGSASPLFAYQTLETLLLDAVARRRLGDHDGAAASVERALRIAEPEGYRQVFWNLGVEVRALLMRQRDRGSAHRQLLADLLDTPAFAPPPATASPVEPLTDREQTVLRYLSSKLSTRQIANELYVSVNTVRSHVRSVYRKLDANRRDDAVRRARSLGSCDSSADRLR
jgi:LuxR family maltose regulon positive regulatory protein